jgi:hypothetical protein
MAIGQGAVDRLDQKFSAGGVHIDAIHGNGSVRTNVQGRLQEPFFH